MGQWDNIHTQVKQEYSVGIEILDFTWIASNGLPKSNCSFFRKYASIFAFQLRCFFYRKVNKSGQLYTGLKQKVPTFHVPELFE